jgi:hypothetical protein
MVYFMDSFFLGGKKTLKLLALVLVNGLQSDAWLSRDFSKECLESFLLMSIRTISPSGRSTETNQAAPGRGQWKNTDEQSEFF